MWTTYFQSNARVFFLFICLTGHPYQISPKVKNTNFIFSSVTRSLALNIGFRLSCMCRHVKRDLKKSFKKILLKILFSLRNTFRPKQIFRKNPVIQINKKLNILPGHVSAHLMHKQLNRLYLLASNTEKNNPNIYINNLDQHKFE